MPASPPPTMTTSSMFPDSSQTSGKRWAGITADRLDSPNTGAPKRRIVVPMWNKPPMRDVSKTASYGHCRTAQVTQSRHQHRPGGGCAHGRWRAAWVPPARRRELQGQPTDEQPRPRLTESANARKWALQLTICDQELQMPTIARPASANCDTSSALMAVRCTK